MFSSPFCTSDKEMASREMVCPEQSILPLARAQAVQKQQLHSMNLHAGKDGNGYKSVRHLGIHVKRDFKGTVGQMRERREEQQENKNHVLLSLQLTVWVSLWLWLTLAPDAEKL